VTLEISNMFSVSQLLHHYARLLHLSILIQNTKIELSAEGRRKTDNITLFHTVLLRNTIQYMMKDFNAKKPIICSKF
jgi:hypothetical protein